MRVQLRPDGDGRFLAYFNENRRIMEVNTVGARLLELLLNQELEFDAVVRQLCEELNEIVATVRADAHQFIATIEERLSANVPDMLEQRPHGAPVTAELQINAGCNLRCRHCFQEGYDPQSFLPIEQARWIISELARTQVFEVSIIGGEPLLYKWLEELLESCTRMNIATTIVTNATLLTDQVAELLYHAQTHVNVSVDGVGAVHDRIRGAGVFAKVNEALHRLQQLNVPVSLLCTLNVLNADYYEEVVAYALERGMSVSFNLFKPTKPEHDALILPPERYFQICCDLFAQQQRGSSVSLANAAITRILAGGEGQNECSATLVGLVIDCASRMVPCPGLVSCGYLQEEALPIFDENWLDTWHTHPVFQDFRAHGYHGCQVRSCIFEGNPDHPDPYSATALQEYMKR